MLAVTVITIMLSSTRLSPSFNSKLYIVIKLLNKFKKCDLRGGDGHLLNAPIVPGIGSFSASLLARERLS
jgi:hypothetical protein